MPFQHRGIKYIGTGTLLFQAHPCPTPNAGGDWDYLIERYWKTGALGPFRGPVSPESVPRMLDHASAYIKRSAELGQNMFRFSLELGRLSPSRGSFNEDLMRRYMRILAELRATGHEPMLTLLHFTMPLYLCVLGRDGDIAAGAWEHPDVVKELLSIVDRVCDFLANREEIANAARAVGLPETQVDRLAEEGLARFFMPINEPTSTMGHPYFLGSFPPYKKGRVDKLFQVMAKMAEFYKASFDSLKELAHHFPADREPQIGNGYNWVYFDGRGAGMVDWFQNRYPTTYLERHVPSDFIGLQYYCRSVPFGGVPTRERGSSYLSVGDVYPAGIYPLLQKMGECYPGKDIFITEMGFADSNDRQRPYWISETLRHIFSATRHGVPVKGILYWSMVRNLEWDWGMTQNFGLFEESEVLSPLRLNTSEEEPRSWQLWQAAAKHVQHPTVNTEQHLMMLAQEARDKRNESEKERA